jgi:hypothetical protein
VTGEVGPGQIESVESGSWTDYLLTGSRVRGTRALRAGGGIALEVPGDPTGSLIIGFYRDAAAGTGSRSNERRKAA